MIQEQNNIVDFDLLNEHDMRLIEKILDTAKTLEYYETKYTGNKKYICQGTELKDFWNWIIKEYLRHLE